MFEYYSKEGNIYTWFDKILKDKFQFHFEKLQFRDRNDHNISKERFKQFREHPVLKIIFDEGLENIKKLNDLDIIASFVKKFYPEWTLSNLTIKEWQRLIDQSIENVEQKSISFPINVQLSFGVKKRDIKIFEFLKLSNWKSQNFKELLKYVFQKYNPEIRSFVYFAVKEGILDVDTFIEENNLYKNKKISDDSGENLLFFAIFHLLNEKTLDSTKINNLMEMIAVLFKFGFNPAYKPYDSFKNAYDLLGKENAESLFGPETNYPKENYALEKSRLDKLYDFPKKQNKTVSIIDWTL
jgi:hypothetical protein